MRTWLKDFRKKNGYTQEQLASRLSIAPTTLSGYELGTRSPSVQQAKDMAEVMGVKWTIFFDQSIRDTRKQEA